MLFISWLLAHSLPTGCSEEPKNDMFSFACSFPIYLFGGNSADAPGAPEAAGI